MDNVIERAADRYVSRTGVWFTGAGIHRVLVVGDDLVNAETHVLAAQACGWSVRAARSAGEAVESDWAGWTPDVVLLDVLLPRVEMYQAIRALRGAFGTPVAVVVEAADAVTASAPGERGVIPLARAGAVGELRHLSRSAVAGTMVQAGPLSLSLASRVARLGTRALMLSADEAATLACLMASPGESVSRRALVAALGGLGRDLDPRLVDVHAVRLMVAIGDDPRVRLLRTADRDGYVLHVAGATAAG